MSVTEWMMRSDVEQGLRIVESLLDVDAALVGASAEGSGTTVNG